MRDQNFGWTMEMQVKALRLGLKVGELPVRYRARIGKSKITGTLKGTFLAGYKILYTLAYYSFLPFRPEGQPKAQPEDRPKAQKEKRTKKQNVLHSSHPRS